MEKLLGQVGGKIIVAGGKIILADGKIVLAGGRENYFGRREKIPIRAASARTAHSPEKWNVS